MRNGGSSAPGAAAAAGGGGGSLAITERQKPAPSCVASLFQMLAKKKLFSSSKKSKMLPPVRAPRFSPGKPPGGSERTPRAKTRPLLLDSVNYPRSKNEGHDISHLPPTAQDNSCNEMCTPGVVARLMGLSSMPAVSHQRPAKCMDSFEHRNDCSQGLPCTNGSIGTSYQKQQKPGLLIDEWHGNSSQLNTDGQVLWPQRHPHKVASSLKSPRSISSRNKARLIEAAAKVLEPGLQSRNRHLARRHARLEYSCNSDGVAGAAAGLQKSSDQSSRDMCDADVPRSGARNVGVSTLHKSSSNQWSEENAKRNASIMRLTQNESCQLQPKGNNKGMPVSSSEKARLKDSAQRRNTSQDIVACSPFRQNNLKQNALPVASQEAHQRHMVQRQKHSGDQNVTSTAKDFVSLHRNMSSNTSLRSKGKAMDRFAVAHGSVENKNMSTKGHRTSGLQSDASNKPKLKAVAPRAMERDMIIAKGAGMVTEKPKSSKPNSLKNGLRRQVESCNVSRCNNSAIVSFTFSSPTKGRCTLPGENTTKTGSAALGSPTGTDTKRDSHRDCQSVFPQRDLVSTREILQGRSSMDTAESVSFNQNELKNRDIPGGGVAHPLFKKMSVPVMDDLRDELLWQCNIVDDMIYGFRDLSKPAKNHGTDRYEVGIPSPSISRGHNQQIPLSFLQSTYAHNDRLSGRPHYTTEAEFRNSRPSKACAPPSRIQDVTTTTERDSRCAEPNSGQHGVHRAPETAVQDSKTINPEKVTSTAELLLTVFCRPGDEQKPRAPPYRAASLLGMMLRSALATFTTTTMTKHAVGDLAFDLVMEHLDTTCDRLCGSGYRPSSRLLAMVVGCHAEERLATEVEKEITMCSAMAGKKGLDDLAVGEVERAVEAGMSPSQEALRIGAQIEQELVLELVEDLGLDIFRRP